MFQAPQMSFETINIFTLKTYLILPLELSFNEKQNFRRNISGSRVTLNKHSASLHQPNIPKKPWNVHVLERKRPSVETSQELLSWPSASMKNCLKYEAKAKINA